MKLVIEKIDSEYMVASDENVIGFETKGAAIGYIIDELE